MLVIYKHLTGQHDQSTHASGSTFKDVGRAPNTPDKNHPYYQVCRSGADVGGAESSVSNGHTKVDGVRQFLQTNPNDYTAEEKKGIAAYANTKQCQLMLDSLRQDLPRSAETQAAIDGLDSAFNGSFVKENSAVYRGIDGAFAREIAMNAKEGYSFQDKGYTSTTTNKNMGYLRMSVALKINVSKGSRAVAAQPYTRFLSESEWILPRGSIFKFNSKVYDDSLGKDIYVFDYIEGE